MVDYWFRPQPVVDPNAGGILVPSATFQVFAGADRDFTTPLTVYTMVGGALTAVSTLTTNGASVVDDFMVVDQWQVWLRSGDHWVLVESVQGLAEAAEDSRMAALAAQSAAEAAATAAASAVAASSAQIDSHLGGPAAGLVNTVAAKADLVAGKVPVAQLPAGLGMADATASEKGAVRLSGDLGGTSDAPTVPGLVGKANDAAVVHRTGDESVAGAKTFLAAPTVPDGSFAMAKLAATGTRDSSSFLRGDGQWATPPGSVVYGTTAGTAAQGNDARIVGAVRTDTAAQGLTSTQQGNARSNLGLGNAKTVMVYSGTGYRLPGEATDRTSRPTTNPIHLSGGPESARPAWVNQDGDSHAVSI